MNVHTIHSVTITNWLILNFFRPGIRIATANNKVHDGCSCRASDCSNARCSCVKKKGKCHDNCGCMKEKCKNIDGESIVPLCADAVIICSVIECDEIGAYVCTDADCNRNICELHNENGHISHSNGTIPTQLQYYF